MPAPSRFTSPNSPLCMKRIPGNNNLLAIWNPIPNYNGRVITKVNMGRTPLVLATSPDNGKTWSEIKFIEDSPDAGYCYTAIHFSADNHVLLAYCAGNDEYESCLCKLVIRKICINDLY